MRAAPLQPPLLLALLSSLLLSSPPWPPTAGAVGVSWGMASSDPLPPAKVVGGLLLSNNITRVRLFDADPLVLESLSGTGIGVAVGIPNEMLWRLNSSVKAAESWVHDNVTRYLGTAGGGGGGLRIEYIAVGDEPFLLSYGQQFQPFVLGAATNVQLALAAAKLTDKVKVIVPCSSDSYQSNSSVPSKGQFRPDLNRTMTELLSFLKKHGSPFVISINPFLSLHLNKNFTMDHALFQSTSRPIIDGHNKYQNIFDASLDTLVTSLAKAGFGDMDIIIGKVGWPTDGAKNASVSNAEKFMKGLVDHLQSKAGSPLRPKKPPLETYIFSLLDEDKRSVANGNNFERHWGIFTFDGQAKYNVPLGDSSKSLVNAKNVEYLASRWCVVDNNKDISNASAVFSDACSQADCTALSPGGSCAGVSWPGNVSYAMNSYYQQHDQRADSCDFGGLGLITTVDPSVDECRFPVGLVPSLSTPLLVTQFTWLDVIFVACISLYLSF